MPWRAPSGSSPDGDGPRGATPGAPTEVLRLDVEHRWAPVAAQLTTSIGVAAVRPSGAVDDRRLLRDADVALHRATSGGRDRVGSSATAPEPVGA